MDLIQEHRRVGMEFRNTEGWGWNERKVRDCAPTFNSVTHIFNPVTQMNKVGTSAR
jgi:hypothetical protein